MLGTVSPRRVSKPRNRKIAFAKTSSCPPSHRGWMLSTYSPRPVSEVTKSSNPPLVGQASAATFLDYQALSVYQIDALAENSLDWISLLPTGAALDILNLSLLGVESSNSAWHQAALPIEKLVQLTQQAKHYPVRVTDSMRWSYTCCLQLADLGRVRFVVCYQGDQPQGQYVAFITNRLDWSPRKVMAQSLQLSTFSNLLMYNVGASANRP